MRVGQTAPMCTEYPLGMASPDQTPTLRLPVAPPRIAPPRHGILPADRRTGHAADEATSSAPTDTLVGRRPPPQPRRKRRSVGLALAVIVLLAGAVLGVRYGRPHPAAQFVISNGPLNVELNGPGTLDAIRKATISSRVQGRLTDLPVDRNDSVAQGALIAKIASEDLAQQLAAAVASHQAAAHAINQARADKTRSEAALANAESAHARKSALLPHGWITRADYDASFTARRQAQADLARAAAAVEAAEAQRTSAAATVQVFEAQLQEAIVRAPFAGIVVSRDRNPGDIVTPGAPIVQLVDPSTIVLTARFDESATAITHPGQAAHLRFSSQPDRPIGGRILRLSRQVDTETREFTVDIVPDELPTNWAIGQRGAATIVVSTRQQVLSVPDHAIVRRNGKPGLWLVVDGRARWRTIELGQTGGRFVEVLGGLPIGGTVLAPDGVFEWMRVRKTDAAL